MTKNSRRIGDGSLNTVVGYNTFGVSLFFSSKIVAKSLTIQCINSNLGLVVPRLIFCSAVTFRLIAVAIQSSPAMHCN
jgi:hypothetical protein